MLFDTSGETPELGFPGIDTNSIAFLGQLADGYGSIDIPFNALLAPVAANGSNGSSVFHRVLGGGFFREHRRRLFVPDRNVWHLWRRTLRQRLRMALGHNARSRQRMAV